MLRDPQVRWCAVPDNAVGWRDWQGEVVAFSHKTGSTHLLGELGSEIFRRLRAAERGATVDALTADLTHGLNSTGVAAWTRAVAEVLSDFARRGAGVGDVARL